MATYNLKRKTFSNFSQQPQEKLYSVIMSEEDVKLFSEFLEERIYMSREEREERRAEEREEAARKRKRWAIGLGATALTAGGLYAAKEGAFGGKTQMGLNKTIANLGNRIGNNKVGNWLLGSGTRGYEEGARRFALGRAKDKIAKSTLTPEQQKARIENLENMFKDQNKKSRETSRSDYGKTIYGQTLGNSTSFNNKFDDHKAMSGAMKMTYKAGNLSGKNTDVHRMQDNQQVRERQVEAGEVHRKINEAQQQAHQQAQPVNPQPQQQTVQSSSSKTSR